MKKTTTESDKRGALNLKYRHVNTPNKLFLCLVLLFLLLMSAPVTHAETYTFVTVWGSPGTENGSFASPAGVAVDSSGNVYVADTNNNRTQMFDSNGTFLTTWGSSGADNGSFASPAGVAVDSSGNVYVADMSNNRIQMFDSNGTFLTTWGSSGADNGSFASPAGVAVDSSGNVYVADMSNNRIQKFDSNGTFLTTWGSSGNDSGNFASPQDVAVDPSGNVYVSDYNNNRIQKFDSNGIFLTTWGSSGNDSGNFVSPAGIAVDSAGNIYVSDSGNSRIQKFDSSGNFITTFGSSGSDNGSFSAPSDVAVDSSGNVYVADTANDRIQKFSILVFPVANFSSNVTSGYAPLSVEFTDSSENADEWNWDFGDGNSSTEQNITHTYYVAGNYTVNLTVSNVNGTDFIESIIAVTEEPVLPVANFTSNVTEGYAPLSVEFTDSSENATAWSWDFGDGLNSTEQDPLHVFSTAGNYTVNLTVSNVNGTDSTQSLITVTDEPVPPVANFSSDVTEGYAPLTVQFTDLSENVTDRYWDFGDGNSSTEQNPSYTYFTAGNYTVNLTVSNLNGTDSKLATISVSEDLILPVANFGSNVSSGSTPLTVEFTDLSENATGWSWDFGDGNSSPEQNTTHTYYVTGNYTVNLTVSNLNGTDSIESIITVTESPVPPVAHFSSNVTEGYAPLPVEFTDSSENADERIWNFGDGFNSTDLNPIHVFSTAGNYTVNLTVSNVNGTDSIESIISVTDEPVFPVANFTSNVTSGYVPLTVEFTDSSLNATSWSWNFGDGNSSSEQNPVHIFPTAGTYTVNLTASNLNGTDSKTANITVSDYIYDYCIEKTVLDVSGNGSSANITKAGDIIRYEVCVENKGNVNLTSISVNDSLINLTGPVETLNTNDILEVGEHWHYTGNYTVTQEDLNNDGGGDGFINNTATVDCTEIGAESDSVLVPIEQNPVCSIKKFVLDIAGSGPQGNISSAGDVIQFRINMTNNGNIDLTNISVRDSLLNLSGPYGDVGLFGLYQSSLTQYTSGDSILSVGETWYYLGNYTVTQEDLNNDGGGDGFLNSTVTLESSEAGLINESTIQYVDESGNETGSVSPGVSIERNPSCSFSKSVIEVVNGDNGAVDDAGDIIRYSIFVTNEGNVELTGVSVSDPMISLVGPIESLSTDGVLELGENWTYTGNYTVTEDNMDNEGGSDEDIHNTATLSCNELPNKTSIVEVELIIPESSGGSSHSSGGSGGSPEPSTNIEVKEISQVFVTNGKAVQFDFTKNATCVVYVGFDSKKTAGKITTIAEQLKKKSTLVSNLTEEKVYKYFNVWVGNSGFVSSDNMENMAICFKVSRSWLQNENIGPDSITLNRYSDGKWEELPVSLLKEDSKYLYFTADVPGYSFFAITGKSNASGGSVTEIKPAESEYVEENTGNNSVKPETTDEENTGESGSKFGIIFLIAFLLIACLAVVFLYLRGQENQK